MKLLTSIAFWVAVALVLAAIAGVALWLGGRLPGGLFGQQGTLSNGLVWLLSFAGIVVLTMQLIHSRKRK